MEESAERPPMDLFKAIFENSESSSSSSEAGSDDEDNQQMDADSRKVAVNDVRPDTVSDIAAAAVPEAVPMTVQHPPQQQDYGMMIVLSMNLTNETLLFICFLIMCDFVFSLVLSSSLLYCTHV